jgi:hypothetical protein
LLFPRRLYSGVRKGDVLWGKLEHCHVLRLYTTPGTPASLSMDAPVAARRSTARRWCNTCRASSGMRL